MDGNKGRTYSSTTFGGTDDGNCLIIALDFGTTYSGIAYAFTNDPGQIYTIDSWPGADGRISPKTPTAIQYIYQPSNLIKWGYQLDQTLTDKIVELKSLLNPDQDRPSWIPIDRKAETDQLPKSIDDVVADYVASLFNYALAQIREAYMKLRGENLKMKRKYVLTVPGFWSDSAKARIERAVRKAGISPVDMITEPEAAALYTLHDMKDKRLKNGDAIVICDAGGGTVDLVSYAITSLDPFLVKALTRPTGGPFGSIMLNKSFEQYIEQLVGKDAFLELRTTPSYRQAMRTFDAFWKPSFVGQNDNDIYVSFAHANLRDNKAKGLFQNTMTITGKDMLDIFSPIAQEIAILVKNQVHEAELQRYRGTRHNGVKAVFLVGGFGASTFLREEIRGLNPEVEVIQPHGAWSAIAKGAVMIKLPPVPELPRVESRPATKHYGTVYHAEWEHFRDKEQPKGNTGFGLAIGGDELVRGKKYKYEFIQKFPGHNPEPKDLRFTQQLLESTRELAPVHPNRAIYNSTSIAFADTVVNCELETDLSGVPKEYFQKNVFEGEPFSQITYNLLLENLPSDLMRFSIEIQGVEYAAVEARY
ncbi:hypothetical protein Hte_003963 [Hypoxylon texense]